MNRLNIFGISLVALVACGKPNVHPERPFPTPGQTSFNSAGRNASSGASKNAAGAGASGASADAAETTRTVEEADIDKLDAASGKLYVLNSWRGLMIVDVSNPDTPNVLGRAPVYGNPVEMYVRGTHAFLVVSDYFDYYAPPPSALTDDAIVPRHGSVIVSVDASDAAHPVVDGTVYLDGQISQTRAVGDVIYAVSDRFSWYGWYAPGSTDNVDETYVASIDISTPNAIHEVGRLEFKGNGFQVHATPTRLYVAQTSGDWPNYSTNIQLIDISDAKGKISSLASFAVKGSLADQWAPTSRFALDAYDYKSTVQCFAAGPWPCSDLNTFRIVTHEGGWQATGEGRGDQRLTVFDVTPGSPISELSHVDLPQTGGLFAARFDGVKAYLVTMVTKDPLDIIDLTDPKNPKLGNNLEVPGVLKVLEPRGDRLIALGTSDGTWRGVAVSLYDVSDAQNPRELSRANLTPAGGWNYSGAQYDDKALRILDDEGLIVLPISGWDDQTQTYRTGIQLVDFSRTSVGARGFADGLGEVQRVFGVQHVYGDLGATRLVTTSQTDFATVNIDNRDKPATSAHLTLARDVEGFAALTALGKGVEYVGPGWSGKANVGASIRVLPLAAPDDNANAAEVQLQSAWGRLVHFAGSPDLIFALGYSQNGNGTLLETIDVTGSKPRVRGTLKLPDGVQYWSYGDWGNGDSVLNLGNGIVAFQGYQYGKQIQQPWGTEYEYDHMLYIADLSNSDAPTLISTTTLSADYQYGFKISGHTIYSNHFESDPPPPGQNWSSTGRYFLDRIDVSDAKNPIALGKVNVPGLFVDASSDGKIVYTVDFQWTDATNGLASNAFDALSIDGTTATLLSTVTIADSVDRIAVQGSAAYLTTHPWWWNAPKDKDGNYDWSQYAAWSRQTTLVALDLTDSKNVKSASEQKMAGRFTVRAVSGGHLLLQLGSYGWAFMERGPMMGGVRGGAAESDSGVSSGGACYGCGGYWDGGQGLAAYDISAPLAPKYETFQRTQGWVSNLEIASGTAYIAAGMYGVETFGLK